MDAERRNGNGSSHAAQVSSFIDTTFGELVTGFFGHSLEDLFGYGGGAAPTIAPPSPPPGPNNAASLMIEDETRRAALRRRTLQSTIHAGVGSWYPSQGQLGPGQTGASPRLK